ncbi:MAG: methionine adenosyltransferase [Candidatus Pacebacteria bacterium CG10_big_fil_rev_8_21_14_0_10_36_11]|nr:methionine adenosyltransferase [Candidatus Pacearchaeota archaeon]OIP73587.1 MAG: methionine adenosyltransferase [Candidatus Pacebacteria bacterium CG2_30_36_39]PIR64832.1 MAG: methionine adenosyltransferase [Candidatus Pacebacteria bacterium CG10_big_fil_rev_8_21_14_0_10_36_11]PJC42598.1 MAG: methionine adenosyltransferase [Candidatus Pacebacteria bacterium CG_4_9_14_0_2_um_filter_36_8]
MPQSYIFTSESVCAGHPDKICDQISDAVVDAVLKQDPNGRVAVETLVTANQVVMAGEVTCLGEKPNYELIAREEIKRLGFTKWFLGFTNLSPINVYIHNQSPEIAIGVDSAGAGDQGMMFGYACQDTKNLMPLPIELAHKLAEKIDCVRESKQLSYLRPDGKTQVSVQYENDKPVGIVQVVLAVPHQKSMKLVDVKNDLYQQVVLPVLEFYGFSINKNQLVVNGTGAWYIGGPASDTGVTGRKIVVDTYGGFARVGGGAFSGKDPSKVDRSGAYAARFIAKNIVGNNLAKKAEVRLAYFIGAQKPVMLEIETFGTAKVSDKKIEKFAKELIDLSVAGTINYLNLKQPIYKQTAVYGHFGNEKYSWEKIINS